MPRPRNISILALCCTLAASSLLLLRCTCNPASMLVGQVNATVTFYGTAVDQDGRPLPGVNFEFQVSAYPKDWSYETRGRPFEFSTIKVTSDQLGYFEFKATGCMLHLLKATCPGYRHLYDLRQDHENTVNKAYELIAWGHVYFKPDSTNPATYVFVRDGVHAVTALPNRGGTDPVVGPNKPAWPWEQSLDDVYLKDTSAKSAVITPIPRPQTFAKPVPPEFQVHWRHSSPSDIQTNTTLVFYGLVINQDGEPLPDARIEYVLDTAPALFATRYDSDEPLDKSRVVATSDENGRFQFTVTGCHMYLLNASRPGHQPLFDAARSLPEEYIFVDGSTICYKTNPHFPAVLVFLTDGHSEFAEFACPSDGGFRPFGSGWMHNSRKWPQTPSITGVTHKIR